MRTSSTSRRNVEIPGAIIQVQVPMENNWSAIQNSVFTKTDSLNLSIRDGLSDKIAIIDSNGIVVAQNDAFDEWTRRAGGANFPYSDLCLLYTSPSPRD